jgi:hypothetical protein
MDPKIVVLTPLLLLASPAAASADATPAAAFTDEVVARLLGNALDNLPLLICEENRRCAPATGSERADPPVSIEIARGRSCADDLRQRIGGFMP